MRKKATHTNYYYTLGLIPYINKVSVYVCYLISGDGVASAVAATTNWSTLNARRRLIYIVYICIYRAGFFFRVHDVIQSHAVCLCVWENQWNFVTTTTTNQPFVCSTSQVDPIEFFVVVAMVSIELIAVGL